MPIRLKAAAKFQWAELDGLPVAHVATFGGIAYVLVCPLCSCCHELPGQTFTRKGQQRTVEPRCLLREFATSSKAAPWHKLYSDWTAKHPVAKEHTEVCAVFIGKAADLPAAYAGYLPSAPVPAVSIVRVKEQERQAKQRAKEQRSQARRKKSTDQEQGEQAA